MSNFINKVYKNNAIVYKVLLFLITVVSIVYLFPKGGQFKYDFNKGKPWQYDNLYATFDFSIQKTEHSQSEFSCSRALLRSMFISVVALLRDMSIQQSQINIAR